MAKSSDDEETIPAGPMVARLKDRGQKSAFADKMGISPQVLTNWIARETVPLRRLRKICKVLGVSEATYCREAGLPSHEAPATQGKLDTGPLLRDFEALPPALRDYVAAQAAELRETVESVRPELRPLISPPPKDPAHYREWEQSIKALIAMRHKP